MCGDAEVGVEWAIGFAVAEEIDRERRAIRECKLGRDVAPEKAARAEPVNEENGSAAMSVPLHVHGARSNGNAQQIGVDGSLLGESGYHVHASARQMRSLWRRWIVL